MSPVAPARTVVVLPPDDRPDLAAAARSLGVALLPGPDRVGADLVAGAFAVEERADVLRAERFAVLARGEAAALGLAVAYVLPHRTGALGLVAPGPLPPPGPVAAGGLTVPTLVWPGGAAAAWVAVVPGARAERGPARATEILRRLVAAAR